MPQSTPVGAMIYNVNFGAILREIGEFFSINCGLHTVEKAPWGCRDRGFKSRQPDFIKVILICLTASQSVLFSPDSRSRRSTSAPFGGSV